MMDFFNSEPTGNPYLTDVFTLIILLYALNPFFLPYHLVYVHSNHLCRRIDGLINFGPLGNRYLMHWYILIHQLT